MVVAIQTLKKLHTLVFLSGLVPTRALTGSGKSVLQHKVTHCTSEAGKLAATAQKRHGLLGHMMLHGCNAMDVERHLTSSARKVS